MNLCHLHVGDLPGRHLEATLQEGGLRAAQSVLNIVPEGFVIIPSDTLKS